MGNENTGRRISKTVGHRKKLADITNTPLLLKSRIDDETAQFAPKGLLAQLQEELANVKKVLEEKEEIIAESKRCMEKLWINYCRKSKQNDEIILHNSHLYRDLTQVRDQLKVLQHENVQMSALYRVCKLEMQEKLNEALEQVDRLTKLVEASSLEQASDKHCPASTVPGHSSGDIAGEDSVSHDKSLPRKRERKSYKEPSLRVKLRQTDASSVCPNESIQSESKLPFSVPAESKGSEASTNVGTSASCGSEMKRGVENIPPMKASQQCTEKGQTVPKPKTLPQSCERPRRRAVSSMGSYKEPSLNTKMRRAA